MPHPLAQAIRAVALTLCLAAGIGAGIGLHAAFAETGLGLDGYGATVEARPIPGIARNLSGLTYSNASNSLFAAVNRPAAIVELTTEGRVLRRFSLPAGWDAEGIAHVARDLFVIADEAGNLLHWVRLPAQGGAAIHLHSVRLRTGWRAWPNMGFEGVSWDRTRAELLVVNERWPRKVLIVTGLGPAGPGPRVTLREWWPTRRAAALGADLASVAAGGASGNLLLLSEESARITEYTRTGAFAGMLALRAGSAGLARDVPQPEGMAIGPDGAIYVVSEPNLFYRFSRNGGD